MYAKKPEPAGKKTSGKCIQLVKARNREGANPTYTYTKARAAVTVAVNAASFGHTYIIVEKRKERGYPRMFHFCSKLPRGSLCTAYHDLCSSQVDKEQSKAEIPRVGVGIQVPKKVHKVPNKTGILNQAKKPILGLGVFEEIRPQKVGHGYTPKQLIQSSNLVCHEIPVRPKKADDVVNECENAIGVHCFSLIGGNIGLANNCYSFACNILKKCGIKQSWSSWFLSFGWPRLAMKGSGFYVEKK